MCKTNYYLVGILLILQSSLMAKDVVGETQPTLFDNVAKILADGFYNETFRENELPKFIQLYEPRAAKADTLKKQLLVVHDFLSNIPASHMAIFSDRIHEHMLNDLTGKSAPTFGFNVVEYDGKHYADDILEKGPAALAGIRRGDRIVSMDGLLVDDSPRLSWRTDDAFLPDPPVRFVYGEEGEMLLLRVESTPGVYRDVTIPCKNYSAWEATEASARIVEYDGKRMGVIHFWVLQLKGPDVLLKAKLQGAFASCDAFILDLRGRGGNASMVKKMLDILEGITSTWNKPTVAIINQRLRSAKEVLAYNFRKRKLGTLVGERTAGAVIPVTMNDVGFGMKLMFPRFTMPEYTEALELVGVSPDVFMAEAGPYSHGADPIFQTAIREAAHLAESPIWKNRPKNKYVAAHKTKSSRRRTRRHKLSTSAVSDKENNLNDPTGHEAKAMDELKKMVIALGGEEVLRDHAARTVRGKINIGGMMKGEFVVQQLAPSRILETINLPGMGQMQAGYNGAIGWEVSPHQSAKVMSREDLQEVLIEGDIHLNLNYSRHYLSIQYVGRIEFDEKRCHELRLTTREGKVKSLYIDASNDLLAGSKREIKTDIGPMSMTLTVKEYKAFSGEMFPVHYVEDIGGVQKRTSTVTTVSFDSIPDGTFDPPKSLRVSGDD